MLVGVSQAGRAERDDGLGEPSMVRHLLTLGYDVSRRARAGDAASFSHESHQRQESR